MVLPAARPPACSKWTHSLQYFTPRSVPLSSCCNAAAGIDTDPSQSSLDFKWEIASEDIRKAFTFCSDFPQPSFLHPVHDRLAQLLLRWPLHGYVTMRGWMRTDLVCGTEGVLLFTLGKCSALLTVRGKWTNCWVLLCWVQSSALKNCVCYWEKNKNYIVL